MMYTMIWQIVIAWSVALYMLGASTLWSQSALPDSLWIPPDELEPDFALVWTSSWNQHIPLPKWWLYGLAVSPDGRWLAYVDGALATSDSKLRLMDLRTGAIEVLGGIAYRPLWSPDSRVLKFVVPSGAGPDKVGTWFLNMETRERIRWAPVPPQDDDTIGYVADTWGPDGNLYLINIYTNRRRDTISLWRILLQESLAVGHRIFEPVGKGGLPYFPPGDTSWHVTYTGYDIPDEESKDFSGFNIVRGFDWETRKTMRLAPSHPEWYVSKVNTWAGTWFVPDYSVGPQGEVYMHLSFRAKSEDEKDNTPPFTEQEMEARRASGWYRVDTTGTKRVQLVSSVTHGLGLSITADGQRIYYGRLMPDSTCVVWEMNRWGREKRQVTFAGRASAVTGGDAAGSGASLDVRDGGHAGELVASIDLAKDGVFDLVVVAMDGREVAWPLRREYLAAGRHERMLRLDGLASGTYLVSLAGAGTSPVVSTKIVVGK